MSRPAAPDPEDPGAASPSGDVASEAAAAGSSRQDPDDSGPLPSRRGLSRRLKIAAAAFAALAVLAAVVAYRKHQERRIVAISMARAKQLVRSDTWLGYHEAAALLGVRAARIDPLDAGSLRALALAMRSLDYRDPAAAPEASEALVEPARAANVPVDAQLAMAALALREGRAGTALEYVTRAGDDAYPQLLYARVALLAGNAPVAAEAIDRALSRDPELPAALAIRGDLLRRTGRAEEARAAYSSALASSSRALAAGIAGSPARSEATAPHARATFGLAKLALSRQIPPDAAVEPLARLVDDRAGTPQVERARAAMYLAALQGRAADRAGATAALDKTGVDGSLRAWLEKTAGQLEVERGHYRVPDATPAVLLSASDDDPYVPPPPPPRAEPPPPQQVLHGFKVHPATKKAAPKQRPHAKRTDTRKTRPGVR